MNLSSTAHKTGVGVLIVILLAAPLLSAQTPAQPSGQDQPEVLRVYTELVQTDVTVLDKQGRFVDGLKKEDFELKIDGQVKPIDFFERLTAGSADEEKQLAAARGDARRGALPSPGGSAVPLDRGRTVFFYIDDLHLDIANLPLARKVVNTFIDKQMGQNDQAAIASASGTVGFLQQLTNNKVVLRAALERIKYRPYSVRDTSRPIMNEHQALLIDRYDRDIKNYFVEETLKEIPLLRRETAEVMVENRARVLIQQGVSVTNNTLLGLEGLVKAARNLPGRKLVFFISDGFFLDQRNSDANERIRRITSAAARSGVVIYSMDSRGLSTGMDISMQSNFDPTGRLQRAALSEIADAQQGLTAIARDTGGKAIRNTNTLEPGLVKALQETSLYYLLAWKPQPGGQKLGKFRQIEVKVIGKPDLTVQVRRGFFDVEPQLVATDTGKSKRDATVQTPAALLSKVVAEAYPKRDIPISLSLNYTEMPPKGPALSTWLQVPHQFLTFDDNNGVRSAFADVSATFFNDKGDVGAVFNNRLKLDATAVAESKPRDLFHSYRVYLKPGLYQVRVGVRDDKSGRAGSEHAWIEIPDLSKGELGLSSLLIGAREISNVTEASTAALPNAVELSVAHHFSANAVLRFMIFVYNPALASGDPKPDVALQVQMTRDEQPVLTTPLKKLSLEGVDNFKSIPYAAEVSLEGLPAGRYLLKVTAVDRISKRSTSQQTYFEIE